MAENKRAAHCLTGVGEVEEDTRDEAGKVSRFENCSKNRGHPTFIPVDNISTDHLPINDGDIVEMVNALADLTVLVAVTSISPHRPKICLDSETPSPLNGYMDTKVNRTGSGRVFDLRWFSEADGRTCPCLRCRRSPTPSKEFAEVSVFTATHVVFDTVEATSTICWLFYDNETSSKIAIEGQTVEETDVVKDGCRLTCVTCDKELAGKISLMFKRLGVVWERLRDKYKATRDDMRLAIIVSHPHGGVKYVTVGRWTEVVKFEKYRSVYTYTTDTCPGSSGAAVYILGSDCWYDHVHSGVSVNNRNYSTAGWG